jgi:indole-3-glycerol phosphate synthase
MRDLLAEIVEHKQAEVQARKRLSSGFKKAQSTCTAGRFEKALLGEGQRDAVRLIAEVKPKSPSAGQLAGNNLDALLAAYSKHAHALSVLTDKKYFDGSLDLLREAAGKTGLPVLCKDFFIDEFQVYEAQNAGVDAVLLIVKISSDETLRALHGLTVELGMTAVVEIQNEAELSRALPLAPQILLINNRDLTSFEISFETTKRLSKLIPKGITVVSASGIESRADIETLLPYASRFLVGSSIMRSDNPENKLKELLSA